jgi:epoxyqueuosine reductase
VIDSESVKARATELGFARAGIARAEALGPEGDHLRAWLAAGRHASMEWMASTADVRIDPRDGRMLAGARSIVALAAPLPASPSVGPSPGVVARYARGRDYHNVLGKRAKRLAAWLRERGHAARASVDAMPVFERAWAHRAGLGFVGKNCCLIVPGIGSHVMLGAIVTDAELEPDAPMPERCGACTRCLEACPTRAFDGPRELDARRCISYLTIEHEGPIEESFRAAIGDRFLGCDACQDVCPFNRASEAAVDPALGPDARWETTDAAAILAMSDRDFDAFSLGSPVRRPGRVGAARNAALVLGNAGDRRHLPVLRQAAASDPDASVRDAAEWALERLAAAAERPDAAGR